MYWIYTTQHMIVEHWGTGVYPWAGLLSTMQADGQKSVVICLAKRAEHRNGFSFILYLTLKDLRHGQTAY
jgi:hypothetical protein